MLTDAWRVIVRRAKAKYKYKALPYLCVFEATKAGEPHLHILARVKWISHKWMSKEMKKLINAPIVHIEEVKSEDDLARYLSKYIGKDPHRFATCKRYWSTQDWEIEKFVPEPPPGRWPSHWTIERVPLDQLAREWELEGMEVERSRRGVQCLWKGPPADELAAVDEIYRRRDRGLPW